MSPYYPAFLNIKEKRCVVIGGGVVAEGKVVKLRDAGAKITVVSPQVTDGIQAAVQQGHIEWEAREYRTGDLQGAFLGIATTDVRSINDAISKEAEDLGVLLNVVDQPDQCSFIAPSIVNRGPVTVAISTGGASPALARKFREELTISRVLDWADLAGVMTKARNQIKKRGLTLDPQRWQCSLTPDLLQLAQEGREEDALTCLLSKLVGDDAPDLCPEVERCKPEGCLRDTN